MLRCIIFVALLCPSFFVARTATLERNPFDSFLIDLIQLTDKKTTKEQVTAGKRLLLRYPEFFQLSRDRAQFYKVVEQSTAASLSGDFLATCKAMDFLFMVHPDHDIISRAIEKKANGTYTEKDLQEFADAWELVPMQETMIKTTIQTILYAINSFQFSNSPILSSLQNPETGIDMSHVPKHISAFFDLVLHHYFNKLPVEKKKRILLEVLKLPANSSTEEKLFVLLNQCGPVLQKAFQLFAKESKSDFLKKTLERLKSEMKPFPNKIAKRLIENSMGKRFGDVFSGYIANPISAATIGQVYILPLKKTKKEIAVKVKRPGVEEIAKEEILILRSLTQDPSLLKMIGDFEKNLLRECDLTLEAANIQKAAIYKGKAKGKINPIRLADGFPASKDVLFMEKAEGFLLSKVPAVHLPQKAAALQKLLHVWFENALFYERFFHADLHGGNMFFKPTVKSNLFFKTHPSYKMTLIDFGSVGTLSQSEVKSIVKVVLGSIMPDANLLQLGFSDLFQTSPGQSSEEGIRKQEAFYSFIQKRIPPNAPGDINNGVQIIEDIINHGLSLGLAIPENVLLFYRGKKMIEDQLIEANKQAQAQGLKITSSVDIYRQIFRKHICTNLWWTMGNAQTDKDALIDNNTVFNILGHYCRAH